MKTLPFIYISFGFDEFFPIFAKFPQTNQLVFLKFVFKLNKNSSKLQTNLRSNSGLQLNWYY